MIYFINDKKPLSFTFSGNDRDLYKLYKSIIPKVDKEEPFNQYNIQVNDNGFTFEKR